MRVLRFAASALAALAVSAAALARPAAPIRVAGQTDLPGYTGDFDHFAVDLKDNRLFLAGEDGGALEVFDLRTGKLIKSVPGFDAPHSLLYLPATGELAVIANGGSRVLNARTLAVTRPLKLGAGADSMAYDVPRQRAYVVTGGKDVNMKTTALVEIDLGSGRSYGETPLDGDHTEALAVEQHGERIFINQTDKNLLDVIDKRSHRILARWKIAAAEQNAPVAYDEKTHRLFVITRKPGKVIVMNADTGAVIQTFDAPARVDQAIWDEGDRRLFVCGGDGHLAIFEQDSANRYRALPPVATPPASKTGIYVPSVHRLYLAASPGDTHSMAKLVWLDVEPRR
jgi:DNA-binding beta-propeller fold protein YncE